MILIRVSGVEYDHLASRTSSWISDRISELEAKLKPEQDLFADKYNRGEVDPRTVEVKRPRSPSLEEELASEWWRERKIMIERLKREALQEAVRDRRGLRLEEAPIEWWRERQIMIDQLVREQQSARDNGWDWGAFARTLCYRWVLEYAELIVPELGRLYWKAFGRKRYLREVQK